MKIRTLLWLKKHDIRLFGIPLEQFQERTFLRYIAPARLRLQLRLARIEMRFNHGHPVYSSHPWLQVDTAAARYLNENEYFQYHKHRHRLIKRATLQEQGYDVCKRLRAKPGWLRFSRPLRSDKHTGW